MKTKSVRRASQVTAFVVLDTRRCEACWKCIEACSSHAIGRINLPWHKHARFIDGNRCTGCMSCLNVCSGQALQKRADNGKRWERQTRRPLTAFTVNLGLLFSGLIMVFSGLLIQVRYHMDHYGDRINNDTLGISYQGWSDVHKLSVVILSLFMIVHLTRHQKWYLGVIKKNRIKKNIQLLTLSVMFVLVAITGYIPWCVHLFRGDAMLRKTFIEIHDKLAIVMAVYLILHVVRRLKWFFATVSRLTHKESTPPPV